MLEALFGMFLLLLWIKLFECACSSMLKITDDPFLRKLISLTSDYLSAALKVMPLIAMMYCVQVIYLSWPRIKGTDESVPLLIYTSIGIGVSIGFCIEATKQIYRALMTAFFGVVYSNRSRKPNCATPKTNNADTDQVSDASPSNGSASNDSE